MQKNQLAAMSSAATSLFVLHLLRGICERWPRLWSRCFSERKGIRNVFNSSREPPAFDVWRQFRVSSTVAASGAARSYNLESPIDLERGLKFAVPWPFQSRCRVVRESNERPGETGCLPSMSSESAARRAIGCSSCLSGRPMPKCDLRSR